MSAAFSSFISSLVVSWWVEWWRHYCAFFWWDGASIGGAGLWLFLLGVVSMSAALLLRGCCLFVGWYRSRRLDCFFYLLGGVGGWCGLVALWGVVVVVPAAVSSFVSSLVVSYVFSWHS